MGATNSKSRVAAGTINPFRFIQSGATGPIPSPATNNELLALQCSGPGVEIIGVAAEWTNAMMGTLVQTNLVPQGYPAAVAGQGIRVYEDGEDAIIMVGSGYTVQPDNLLVSDASGNAIPIVLTSTSAVQWIGARAIEGGVAGDPIRCTVYTRPYLGHA